jgi:hypothetical protein
LPVKRKNPSTFALANLEDKNCLSCQLNTYCDNPNKGYRFICEKFTERKTSPKRDDFTFNTDDIFPVQDSIVIPKKLNKSGNLSEFDKIKVDESGIGMDALLDKITEEFSTGLPKDFKIDDRDLPLAKNFMDWSFNPRFAGDDPTPPFPKQIQIALNFFTEYCFNPKCTDVTYAQDIPVDASYDQILSKITLLEHGICPRCKQTRLDIWNNKYCNIKGGRRFGEIVGIAGQRSGKTSGINRIDFYHCHRMFKLNRPHKVFNIEETTQIENTFTATTFDKAKSNFFNPLVLTFKNNKWYKEYTAMLDDYGKRYGEELYKILSETAVFRHRNYVFYPYSPNPQNMRGATRAIANIDEISHLFAKTKEARFLNPGEVRNSLRNSLMTLRMEYARLVKQGFYDIPGPIMCNITSPRSINDEGMRLYRQSLQPDSRIYGFHYSIYDMNPLAQSDPEIIQEIEDVKKDNPEAYRRDYLAVPPSAANAFIEDKSIVRAAILKDHVNGIVSNSINIKSAAKSVRMLSAEYSLRKNYKRLDTETPKIMSLDAGYKRNSFALTISHLHTTKDKYTNEERIYRVFDVLTEVIPKNDRVISYPDLYEGFIAPLIQEFNVVFVCADRWNSIQMLQIIEKEFEIPATQYSVKFSDFAEFKNGLYNGDIHLPMPEIKIDDAFQLAQHNYPVCLENKPVVHTMLQMLTVENLMNKTVEKGEGYTDDIFRAMVLGHAMLINDDIVEELLKHQQNYSEQQAVGVIGSLSGGISSISGANITPQISNTGDSSTSGAGAIGSYSPYGSR